MNHVLNKTYFSRDETKKFMVRLYKTKKLVGNDPCEFWKGASFLDIQGGGASQKETCLSMKLSKAAETQRMSHRGFQSLCHIRVRTVQLPPTSL